jgi:hypothetical protein
MAALAKLREVLLIKGSHSVSPRKPFMAQSPDPVCIEAASD